MLARNREQYLKEIDRRQPISITKTKSQKPVIVVHENVIAGYEPEN
jgi:hypothetical protein